jgi:hypothetical protein
MGQIKSSWMGEHIVGEEETGMGEPESNSPPWRAVGAR